MKVLKKSAIGFILSLLIIMSTNYSISAETTSSEWKYVDGKWYYYIDNVIQVGWIKDDSKWYYLNELGIMQTGWLKDNDKWYYLEESGRMATGWKQVDNNWYYLELSGRMATGWKEVNDRWYYLEASGRMATGWKEVNDRWYYLEPSGRMATDWKQINGTWYYLEPSGRMAIGWKKLNETWYYLRTSGAMATGWEKINNQWYYFYNGGSMATNTVIDQWSIDSTGVAKPPASKVVLNVPYISQYPDMPLGCEATSLAQILKYRGLNVSKIQLGKEMPYSPNKNPDLGFVGSPFENQNGVFQTIYPKAFQITAQKYRPNSSDVTGASVDTLISELRNGNPSIVWVSLNFKEPQMGYWYEGTKDQIWVNKNLHVVALTGFDNDNVYITDPAKGKYTVSRAKFERIYNTVGKRALVVR